MRKFAFEYESSPIMSAFGRSSAGKRKSYAMRGNYREYKRIKDKQGAAAAGNYVRRKKGSQRRLRAMNYSSRGFLGIEKKFLDTSIVQQAIPAPTNSAGAELDPATFLGLTVPAVGDTEINRDGKQIVGKYLEIKGVVDLDVQTAQSTIDPEVKVYVAAVLDTQTNGAQLNSEDVFTNPGAAVLTAASPLRNLLFGPRFKILKSECFTLNARTLSGVPATIIQGGEKKYFDWYIPLKNMPVNFTNTTGVIANVMDNSVHIVAFSTLAICTLSYNSRFRFIG